MDTPLLAFLDLETTGFSPKRGEIIRLNGHDWDQAYAVLINHLEKGNI